VTILSLSYSLFLTPTKINQYSCTIRTTR